MCIYVPTNVFEAVIRQTCVGMLVHVSVCKMAMRTMCVRANLCVFMRTKLN